MQDKHLSDLKTKINNELNAINKWIVADKSTLNLSKINIIIVNSTCHKKDWNFSHYLNANISSDIAVVDDVKYLGVTFDKNLGFDCHIYNLEKKSSRSVGILAKVKPFLNSQTLLQLYYAIFHSHLKYGILALSSTYKTFCKKLSILQNKSVKIIGGGSYYDRATPFYTKLGILKLADLVKFKKAIFVLKFKMKTLPAQFSKYFCEVSSVHKRSTRASTQNYFLSFLKKSKLQNSIRYQGPLIWNSLDSKIKNS